MHVQFFSLLLPPRSNLGFAVKGCRFFSSLAVRGKKSIFQILFVMTEVNRGDQVDLRKILYSFMSSP